MLFRPALGNRLAVEGLEDRRLLSALSVAIGHTSWLERDIASAEVARATHSFTAAVNDIQPAPGNDGEIAGVANAAERDAASRLSRDSGASEAPVSSISGDNTALDPTESVQAARAGNAGSILAPGASTATGSTLAAVSANSARGVASAVAQQLSDDESTAAQPDPSTSEESATIAVGDLTFSSEGGANSEDVAAPLSSAPTAAPAPMAAVGIISEALAASVAPGKGSESASASAGDEIVTPGQMTASIVGFAPLARFVRGGRSQTPLESDDSKALAEEAPGARYAGLACDFLLLDRAVLEKAIDRFLGQYESVAAELLHVDGSSTLLTTVSAAAITALASGVIIQRRRSQDERALAPAEESEHELTLLRRLPSSWNWGLAPT
jgi:hypothetical protein